jgi:hypothetical protein
MRSIEVVFVLFQNHNPETSPIVHAEMRDFTLREEDKGF